MLDDKLICPECNSLDSIILTCNQCGELMENKGKISDYLDDYSPYTGDPLVARNELDTSTFCTHIFYCKNCSYKQNINVNKIMVY